MGDMQLEIRTAVDGTIKDMDEGKRQVLTEFPHDVLDSFKTTFGNDAFRESFSKRMPAICWQHDLKEPIGRTISAQVTHRGNEMIGQLSDFDAVPLAKRAFTQMRDGSLTDTSFGFIREADEKHPEIRGATRITKASMKEWSPVTIGSIPGAVVTGTRAEGADLLMPTLEEILQLRAAGILDELEARTALAELPEWRERIVLAPTTPPEGGGSVEEQRSDLACAIDSALDEATELFGECDLSSLPEPAQRAIGLVTAAGTSAGELLDNLGIDLEARAAEPDYQPAPYHSDGTDAVTCPACKKGNAPDAGYCDQCGYHMVGKTVMEHDKPVPDYTPAPYDAAGEGGSEKVTCPHCGKGDDNDARFCDQCGYKLEGETVTVRAAEAPEAPPAAPKATEERGTPLVVSKKPWSGFKQSDYTPAQWKAACLIGGDTLPVLEPDGTPNANAMAAAVGRLGQVKADPAAIKTAARQLMSMYGKAKMKVPGSLLWFAVGSRSEGDEDLEMRALESEQAEIAALEVFERLGKPVG